ncbi:MAG TPA: hypothetical protein PL182_02595 [Pseudobdellovibrionaceae bacterium]|mgnify:CR=1 FL=1|nr:hypothetical protein [Pseudobdellovibrionaceae bacterium]
MMTKLTVLIACLFGSAAAMAFEYDDQAVSSTSYSSYSSNLKLREERKVGVGTHLGGSAGLLGIHLELNIESQDGVLTGFGFGEGFSTYSIAWKRSYEGLFFTPYTTLGWSRWFSSSGNKSPDSYMLDSTLSRREREEGRFGIDYIVGAVGAQYNQLEGELAGASLFAEVDLFMSPAKGKTMPSAAVGATYFF